MANVQYRDLLETKRLEIVKSINCERSLLLNHLRANQVFDQEDCELILAKTTNDARVGKLIDYLLKKGPDAYQCFLDVVQFDNPTLFESLTGEKASSNAVITEMTSETSGATCACGVMAKSRQKQGIRSCDPETSTCSCAKNGKRCSRNCRCVGCRNIQEQIKSNAKGNSKGCTCGSMKKDRSSISCQDGLRKSKCPCLKNNTYCSPQCRCSLCGNISPDTASSHKDAVSVLADTVQSTPIKRKRTQQETYKRCKGVEYLANNGFDISPGPWTDMETLILSLVLELLTSTELAVSSSNVMELYNFVALSDKVKDMELPIAYKSSKSIIGKRSQLNSKHSVFQSLMDSFSEDDISVSAKT